MLEQAGILQHVVAGAVAGEIAQHLALRFAGRVPEQLRGLSMKDMRAIAQADFAKRWRAKEAANAADIEDDDDDDDDDDTASSRENP